MCSILVVIVAIYAILKLLIYLLSYLLHHQIYCNQTITSITIMKAIEQLSIPGPMPMLCQRQCPHLVSAVSREPAGGQAPSVASGQTHSVVQCSYTTLYTPVYLQHTLYTPIYARILCWHPRDAMHTVTSK